MNKAAILAKHPSTWTEQEKQFIQSEFNPSARPAEVTAATPPPAQPAASFLPQPTVAEPQPTPAATPSIPSVNYNPAPIPEMPNLQPPVNQVDSQGYQNQFDAIQQEKQGFANQQADVLAQARQDVSQAQLDEQERIRKYYEGEEIELPDGSIQKIKGINELQNDLASKRQMLQEQKVDSKRFYNNMDTSQKIGMALMIGLTEYANRISGRGGSNMPLQMLMKAADDDVKDQKLNIQNLKDEYNLSRADLKDKQMMEQVKRAEASKQQAQIMQDARVRMEEITAKGVKPELEQQALNFKLQLEQLEQQNLEKAYQAQKDIFAIKMQRFSAEESQAKTKATLEFNQQKAAIEKAEKANEVNKELVVPGYQLTGEVVPAKDEAKKLRTAQAKLDTLKTQIADYKKLIGEYGPSASYITNSEAAADMDSKYRGLQMTIKELDELGAITGPDMDFLRGQLPPEPSTATGINLIHRSGAAYKKLDAVEKRLQDGFNDKMKSSGYIKSGQPQQSGSQNDFWSQFK